MKKLYGVILILLIWFTGFYVLNDPYGDTKNAVKINHMAGHGSGFYIGNGIIVTVKHIIGPGRHFVRSEDGKVYTGKIALTSEVHDLAIITIPVDNSLTPARLNCSPPRIGTNIWTIGNPMRYEFIRMWGRISSNIINIDPELTEVILLDMTITGGQSGSPIYNNWGVVEGIVSAVVLGRVDSSRFQTGFGIAVPSSVICQFVGEYLATQ